MLFVRRDGRNRRHVQNTTCRDRRRQDVRRARSPDQNRPDRERFGEYLAVERGVTAETVEGYVHAVRPFVAALGGDRELGPRTGRIPRERRVAAELEAAQVTAKLERRALERIKKQLDSCIIKAPQDGIVVYAFGL